MEFVLEEEIYGEILHKFEENQFNTGFEEREIIKLMRLLKDPSLNQEQITDIVRNAIILLLTLFFQKNSEIFPIKSYSLQTSSIHIKRLFSNMLNDKRQNDIYNTTIF